MLIVGVSIHEINELKRKLSKEFAIKDLSVANQILGMRITRDNEILKLSHEEYVKKVLNIFNMVGVKPKSIPLASHFWLSKDQSPSIEQERVYMAKDMPLLLAVLCMSWFALDRI